MENSDRNNMNKCGYYWLIEQAGCVTNRIWLICARMRPSSFKTWTRSFPWRPACAPCEPSILTTIIQGKQRDKNNIDNLDTIYNTVLLTWQLFSNKYVISLTGSGPAWRTTS
jgi:hypothetical protein